MNIKFHCFSFSFFKLSCDFKHKKTFLSYNNGKKITHIALSLSTNRKNKILYEIPADTRFYFMVHAIQIQF